MKPPGFPISLLDSCLAGMLAGTGLPRPRTVNIEPVGNLCQLECPLCPTGIGLLDDPPAIMPFGTFTAILAKLPFIGVLELYRSGEPFLNPELPAMIRYAHERGIKVVVSSHFSFSKPDVFFDEIVVSGLDKLHISLDGASQETYERYRVGGNFELVMANIGKTIAAKQARRSATPEIIWQFLVNRYNEGDIPAARRLAAELNVTLEIRPLDLDDELPDVTLPVPLPERMACWLPRAAEYIAPRYRGERSLPLYPGICRDLFTRMIVTVDGSVMPCCMVWNHDNAFGNLLHESFEQIWYGGKYREARRHFLCSGHRPEIKSICHRCSNYAGSASLPDKLRLALAVYRKSILRLLKRHTAISGS